MSTLLDVERCRQNAESLFRQHKLQTALCARYFRDLNMGRSAVRDAQVQRAHDTKTELTIRLELQLQKYARLSCRQLCHQVVISLPREIRDMIYWAMLERGHPSKNVIQLSRAAHERHLGPLSTSDHNFPPTICKQGIPEGGLQHCWDMKFCEATFVQELVEMCYREKTFEFRQQDIYLLPALLGKGLLQPKAPRQNIVVPIKQVGRLRLCVRPTGNGWNFTLQMLRVLLELERKAKIEFILDRPVIIFGEEAIDLAIGIYSPLFPLLKSMRGRGHTVDVRFGVIQVQAKAIELRSAAEWSDVAQKKLDEWLNRTRPWTQSKTKSLSANRRGHAKSSAVASARLRPPQAKGTR